MDQINESKVFINHGRAEYDPKSKRVINASQGYQKIKEHLVFACKHDRHHKARLVAGGHLTPDPIDTIYSGVASTRSLRLFIFLATLNNMKVWDEDIRNAYLEATTLSGPKYSQHFFLHTTSSMANFKTEKKLHRPFLYIERVLSVYTLNV